MNQQEKNNLLEMLALQAEMREQSLSDNLLQYLFTRLQPYGYGPVMKALERLGMECQYKINLAEIIKRIDDGRPSPQIAWSQVPKSEDDSVVLTEEQNIALCSVSHMLFCGEDIEARMAFLEKYAELIAESRSEAKPVVYVLAAGDNKQGRIDAVKEAVQDGRLMKKRACWMIGQEHKNEILAIDSPKEKPILIEEDVDPLGLDNLAESMRMPI